MLQQQRLIQRTLKKVTEIDLKDVTFIRSYAFCNNANLESIALPNTIKVINHMAFGGCHMLTSVNIPKGIKDLSYTFNGCAGLQEIILPDSILRLYDHVFSSCFNLTKVTIKAKAPPIISTSSFSECHNLTFIYIPKGTLSAYQTATNWSVHASKFIEIEMED